MCVDLHCHSLHSDGTASISELIKLAAALQLSGFAITDHDTVAGQEQAIQLAEEHGVPLITGLEISASHQDRSLHILAYGFNHQDSELATWLSRLQNGRQERNLRILDKLADLGYTIAPADLDPLASLDQTGRPHIARLLVHKKIVTSLDEAFHRFLGRGKAAWMPRFAYSTEETIQAIHRSGGLAVLAHPGLFDPELKILPTLVKELTAMGLDGLEVYYPAHSARITKHLELLARDSRLLCTGGSDYHGGTRPGSRLAGSGRFCPPDTVMDNLLHRLGGHPVSGHLASPA